MDHDRLLKAFTATGASDLHCKPGSAPAVRVAGVLDRLDAEPLSAEDVAVLAETILDTGQQAALIRDGSVLGSHSAPGIGRFRVAAYRQRGSVALVLHAVPHEIRTLESLELPDAAVTLAESDRGLVLVASPSGQGATTTLAALVDHVNTVRSVHVVGVEDPIEVLHRDRSAMISQLEVGGDVQSLADGVRAASRLDADVVTISEVTDRETALAAIDAVARGCLVVGAVGASTVAEAIHSFLELFSVVERDIVRPAFARAFGGVLAQRLVPDVNGNLVAAVESMVRTAKIQHVLVEEGREHELLTLMAEGDYYGMQTMDQTLAALVRSERITSEIALANASQPEELRIELLR